MLFKEVTGLSDVKDRLIKSVRKGKLSHALLLAGEKGSHNLPLALALATYLNCEDKQEHDSCGVCSSCVKNNKFIHPDLHFVFPVATKTGVKPKDIISQTFLVEWREFLHDKPWASEDIWANYLGSEDKQFNISKEESRQIISNLSLKAFEGEFKVMLIWLPEYMNASAANGILKILEEPADKTVFILVTNNKESLLTTILSRVITIPVRKMNQKELAVELVTNFGIDTDKAESLARTSEGIIENALEQSESDESEVISEFRKWLLSCYGFKRAEMVNFTEKFNSLNKLTQRSFLSYGISVLREIIVFKSGAESIKRSSSAEDAFIQKLSNLLSINQIENMFELLGRTQYLLERNVNARTAFMDLSLQIRRLFRAK